jgi:hypothetical protein
MTRQLFFIREKNTNTWCTSSKHAHFYYDFLAASVFLSEDNAKRAIKEMKVGMDPKRVHGPCTWCIVIDDDWKRYTPAPERVGEYAEYLVPDFEVVPFDLIQAK